MNKTIFRVIIFFCILFGLSGCKEQNNDTQIVDKTLLKRYYNNISSSVYGNIYVDSVQQLKVYYLMNRNYNKAAYCNALMGCYYSFTKEYDKAFKVFKEAEACLQYNPILAPAVYYHLSIILEGHDQRASDEYLQRALEEATALHDTLYLGMSILKYSLKLPLDSSRVHMQKSLDLLNTMHNKIYYEGAHFMWIDRFYENEPDTIIKYGVPYINKYHDLDFVESVAKAYIRTHQYDSAIHFLSMIENIGRYQVPYYISKSEMYAVQGDYEDAYFTMVKACDAWKFNLDSTLAYSCKLNNKEKELNIQIEEQQASYRFLSLIFVVVISVVVLLTVILFLLHRRSKKKVRRNYDDAVSKQVDAVTANVMKNLLESYRGSKDYKTMKTVIVGLLYDKEDKQLSNTEVFILWLMALDMSNDDIAQILDISINYLYQIKSKFNNIGINGAVDALNYCSKIVSHKCK